jgi:hypothetical protein
VPIIISTRSEAISNLATEDKEDNKEKDNNTNTNLVNSSTTI